MAILLGLCGIPFVRMAQGVNKVTTADLIYSRMRLMQELSISDGVSRRAIFMLNSNQVRFYATSSMGSELRHLRIVLPPGVTFQRGNSLEVDFAKDGHLYTRVGSSQQAFGGSARIRASGSSDVYIIWYHTGRIRLSPTLD
jgi:hypothetical protein